MDYGTGAIMAVPAHDERDREFAEAFGLPIVEVIDEDGVLVNSGRVRRAARRRGEARDRRVAARAGPRRAGGLVPAARLEHVAAALLGLPDPDHLLRRLRHRPRAGRGPAGAAAGGRGLPAEGQAAARLQRGVDARPVPAVRQARRRAKPTRWTPSSTRRGTSCATSTRTTTRRRSSAPIVDYWLPVVAVHRRDRPPDRAPALLALLRQGDERHGDARLPRAVRAPVPPGLGAAGRHEDVEDEGQRHRARRAGRRVRRRCRAPVHPLHGPRRPGQGVDRGRRSRASSRFLRRLWRVVHEVAERAPRRREATAR